MDTNRLKRFATEARNILMQGVAHRFTALGFLPDGNVTEEPLPMGGGATFMGDTVSEDFYQKWCSLQRAVKAHSIEEVAEEAAYTWFNRMVPIRIMVKNGLISPVLQYESEGVHIPLLVSEARQGRMPDMSADDQRKLEDLLLDDSKTDEQFRILIVAFCHANPVINNCFGHISDYTELLLPTNILAEGGFVDILNNTEFISEEDYHSPELIGWLYQFYISEKKDDVFASFKKGKKAEAKDIPAATQIFTPNWIVKYMVQNTIGRIYLDNNPYEEDVQKNWKYLVEPSEPTPKENILHYDDLKELKFADLAAGSGHILNEGFDMLYDLYILEGYCRSQAIENIFRYNLTGVDIDTRAKQLAQFALLLKACQKDSSFADAHIMPRVLDMPEPYPYKDNLRDTLPHFFLGGNQEMIQEVCDAIDLMDQAKNLGSIMKFNISERTRNTIMIRMGEYERETHVPEAIRQLMPYMSIILALTEKYAAIVMNPPYMGSSNMNDKLKKYLEDNYREGKSDLMTSFMMKAMNDTRNNGLWAMIDLPSWMFISSYEELRNIILDTQHISSLINNGRGIFGSDFGSVTFVMHNCVYNSKGYYRKLYKKHVQVRSVEKIHEIYQDQTFGRYYTYQDYFKEIPGSTFGFWASKKTIDLYNGNQIKDVALFKRGLGTGDNNRFLRLWHEVSLLKFDRESAEKHDRKWQKFNKGGDYRKWFGNRVFVIDWENNGYAICNNILPNGKLASRPQNLQYNYLKNISYSSLTIGTPSFRTYTDFLNDQAGNYFIVNEPANYNFLLGLFNSYVLGYFKEIKNNTVNITAEDLTTIPFLKNSSEKIDVLVKGAIEISRQDWDSHETSWDFEANPLVLLCNGMRSQMDEEDSEKRKFSNSPILDKKSFLLEDFVKEFETQWTERFNQLHENEEELNRQFISIYGLEDELSPDVPLDEITILQQGEITIEKG